MALLWFSIQNGKELIKQNPALLWTADIIMFLDGSGSHRLLTSDALTYFKKSCLDDDLCSDSP